jgi:peptidoglycan/xylan/chitin deacetylase (PgdA/CDA1 family)
MIVFLLVFLTVSVSYGKVITHLPSPAVALTFDGCETITPSYLDETILSCLLKEKIPFTLFVSGKFALRNREKLKDLSRLDFVEIENHSFHHYLHMEKLNDTIIRDEVTQDDTIIYQITGKRPLFFRFPGGFYDARSLSLVEHLNHRVVHWSFPSGDPVKSLTPAKLTAEVLEKTHPGSILIFHINGRGYSTGKALPEIVEGLRKKGFTFVKLEDVLLPLPQLAHTPEVSPRPDNKGEKH